MEPKNIIIVEQIENGQNVKLLSNSQDVLNATANIIGAVVKSMFEAGFPEQAIQDQIGAVMAHGIMTGRRLAGMPTEGIAQ